jgi:Reverse transcriptase (RNA-dependent DNA polymerase).
MKNVRIAFEEYYGNIAELPPGYQRINCHTIFDVKMGENFRRKARMVAGGHVTETPSTLTYSSVVSRDSVRIALTIAALNDLKVLACDIQNAYLTAPCREKIWTIAGPEFGPEDKGKKMLVVRALYGLKSSGAAFRSFLAETLHDMGFSPSVADPDVWMRPAIKEDEFKYWEYILCYVDDVLCVSHKPDKVLKGIASKFKLKDDKMAEPDVYLGADISKMDNEQGHECWAMSSDKYCAAMV